MKKLLKQYSFTSDMQYYCMIADSFLNGQFTQAYEQFGAMPKRHRIDFLKAATVGGWKSGLGDNEIKKLFDRI